MEKINVALATLVDTIPLGNEWIFENKYDGYRIVATIKKNEIIFQTRNHQDISSKLLILKEKINQLNLNQAILDGEIVVEKNGKSSFTNLIQALKEKKSSLIKYYVFDILFLDNRDVRSFSLKKRKELLKKYLSSQHILIYSPIYKNGIKLFEKAKKNQLEGIMAKKIDSPYSEGRNDNWLKIKVNKRQEFIIVGYTKSKKVINGISSLLLGYYDDKKISLAGKVGTGFSQKERIELEKKLSKITLKRKNSVISFSKETIYLTKHRYICEVKFLEWTKDLSLRHPSYLGLRNDKSVKEVRKED